MRKLLIVLSTSIVAALPLAAQEEPVHRVDLLTPSGGLMVWTLLIFGVTFGLLWWKAYPKILEAVEAREKTLSDAIAAAKKDREDAAALLAEHQKALLQTRDEVQKIMTEARASAEKVRADIVEQAHKEQQSVIERARTEITQEKEKAMVELHKQAVELAVRAAGKVIERNLDVETNRAVVESFLASIPPMTTTGSKR
jgi:F-type H+-transporting ATPase subunit b